MLYFLPGQIIGIISLIFYTINTLFWTFLLFILAIFKLILPFKTARKICDKGLVAIASFWVFCNNINLLLTKKIKWTVEIPDNLSTKNWYLVISNHQTWADILVLHKVLYGKIPFLKFFIKKELIWMPVLGFAWWALDFPFMKRYSREYLEKNPQAKGKDLEITKKACEKFKTMPISIMNFIEGTRFKPEKHKKQQSPFKNLLKPKAGGVAFVLASMGDQLNSILNITIVYPQGAKHCWDFFCGKVAEVIVTVENIPITKDIRGDYFTDKEFKRSFQTWINNLWLKKDRKISLLFESVKDTSNDML